MKPSRSWSNAGSCAEHLFKLLLRILNGLTPKSRRMLTLGIRCASPTEVSEFIQVRHGVLAMQGRSMLTASVKGSLHPHENYDMSSPSVVCSGRAALIFFSRSNEHLRHRKKSQIGAKEQLIM